VDGPFIGPSGTRVASFLDRILATGFDGVYLDIVDGYQDFQEDEPQAKAWMVDLVERISRRGRRRFQVPRGEKETHPGFLTFAQNASELLVDPEVGSRFRGALSGIGVEETYFLSHDKRRNEWETRSLEANLAVGREQGLAVLTVDYCKKAKNLREAYLRSRSHGFVPYVTEVDLDRITPPPVEIGWRSSPAKAKGVTQDRLVATPPALQPVSQGSSAVTTKASTDSRIPGRMTVLGTTVGSVAGLGLGPAGTVVGAATGGELGRGLGSIWSRLRSAYGKGDLAGQRELARLSQEMETSQQHTALKSTAAYLEATRKLRQVIESGTPEQRSRAWQEYRTAWGGYVRDVQAKFTGGEAP
jgi:hypothetical protein